VRKRVIIIAVALVLAGAACGGGAGSGVAAADFIKQLGQLTIAKQYARMYETLIPAQREIVSRAMFIACYREKGESFPQLRGASISAVKVIHTSTGVVTVPGTTQRVRATLFTYRVHARLDRHARSGTDSVYLVPSDGSWLWAMDPDAVEAARHGTC
jgi:hypothetical protein